MSLFAANEGFLEDVPLDKVLDFEAALLSYMNGEEAEFMQRINETGEHDDEIVAHLKAAIEKFKATGAY